MPQSGNIVLSGQRPDGTVGPLNTDSQNSVITAVADNATYNLTAATVVKATPGKLARISVIVAGSAVGTANNCITTGAVAAANEIAVIPNTVGVIVLEWPCSAGITVVPGTGQTIAVSWV